MKLPGCISPYLYSLAAILAAGTMSLSYTGGAEQVFAQSQVQEAKENQSGTEDQEQKTDFQYWNDCEALTALQEYVQATTDEQSSDFIPQEDRIAVFDLDGTLVGEQGPIYFEWMMYCSRVLDDKNYTATEEQKKLAKEILEAAKNQSIPEGVEERECESLGDVFAGMTAEEFQDYVRDFLNL